MPFSPIEDALEDFRQGRMLVVVDDEDRENEGDLTVAAEFVTPEMINFMALQGRGLICLALAPEICDRLQLPPMTRHNTSQFGTAFTEAIDAAEGVTTGISAADRARTVQVAIDPNSRPSIWLAPGTCFRFAPGAAASWCEPARPRPLSTWPNSPACNPAASFVR